MATYFGRVLVGVDQLANTLIGGWPDETVSARAWRLRRRPAWGLARRVIDGLFFWQDGHCHASYRSERERAHMTVELREGRT